MKYDEGMIEELYRQNLEHSRQLLASLSVAEGREPNIRGLSGWVYEQTIQYCLREELQLRGLSPKIDEQVSIGGRAKIDLLVDKIAIELKSKGAFSSNFSERYRKYRDNVEKKGWIYMYVTGRERYDKYRQMALSTFGKNRAFFLDNKGDWERFINEVDRTLRDGNR